MSTGFYCLMSQTRIDLSALLTDTKTFSKPWAGEVVNIFIAPVCDLNSVQRV